MLILESTSLCPLEHIEFFPRFPFLCELAIERWRIEMVEDSVSPVHRSAERVCHCCIYVLLIKIYFLVQFMCILNTNIESMDVFNCLYMVDYIIARIALTHLYISCVLCLLLLRENCNCNCIGKSQWGSTSTVQKRVQSYVP